MSDLSWFALTSIPQAEFKAAAQLRSSGYAVIVPSEWKWRRFGKMKRKRKTAYPLFARYVFVGCVEWPGKDTLKAQADLVQGYVSRGDGWPAQISAADVAYLKSLAGHAVPQAATSIHKAIKPGQEVNIVNGPFAGHRTFIKHIVAEEAQGLLKFLGGNREITFALDDLEAA